ncbi:MAG: tetratricopeptide repeat protein [Phycisphaerales bacterium]|nr:tetratricopeptide repeat protein [Phycisphaerales bacterium]MCI0632295.1 tetratricopeptide repeat protein [Phycisphaerales bacterium]MCI0675041.1 tetratricopeptide repeat protein [Phycisphaerales bacterium]
MRLWATRAVVIAAMLLNAGCGLFRANQTDGNGQSKNGMTAAQQEWMTRAAAAKQSGDYDTALTMFQEILAENPTITTAYIGIGDVYVLKKDYVKAEPAYERAAKLEPRNFNAQFGHGLALQMLSKFIEAVRAYHRALTIDPESIKANLNLAITYLQMNEASSAVLFAEKAVSLEPGNGTARINLGAAYEKTGRNIEAIEQYTAALELVEHTPQLLMNLINVLAAERRYQEAANTAETLVKVEPSANAYERMGWCYFRLSQFDKSIAAYREAVKLDPEHWQSHNGIGVNALNTWLLSKQRDTEAMIEARNAFRRSLKINRDQQKLITLMSNHGL